MLGSQSLYGACSFQVTGILAARIQVTGLLAARINKKRSRSVAAAIVKRVKT
jgi:hypothetical protein